MKTLMVGPCAPDRLYRLEDPDAPSEDEFTAVVVRALACAHSRYRCVSFRGTFRLDDQAHQPDLALVARDFSHWFVVEVELTTHSLDSHVLPQVRAFRYGEPDDDCCSLLARELGVSRGQASTLVYNVPRGIVVVANRNDSGWRRALSAIDVQYISVSVFTSEAGIDAIEIEGTLQVLRESLGFGKYIAADKSVCCHKTIRLPNARVQIEDPSGALGWWTIVTSDPSTWITKEFGVPDIPDGAFVQVMRSRDGRLSLRMASDGRPR